MIGRIWGGGREVYDAETLVGFIVPRGERAGEWFWGDGSLWCLINCRWFSVWVERLPNVIYVYVLNRRGVQNRHQRDDISRQDFVASVR